MELILWRHAEIDRRLEDMPESKRPLSSKGAKQAERMAEWLKRRLPRRTRILAATTAAARQTADYLGLGYETHSNLAVASGMPDILAAVGWPDGGLPTVVVCHQPGIGRLAAMLLGSEENCETPVKKCGVFWFSSRERDHRRQMILRVAMHPDML